ncbi:MAG: phosphoribosylanthranilate isomerase [Acaryochloris sp. RU_4_1]|nr:phosphoribosylanthranilate isomerase [Acaryochloris sp. SU_5_25]NJM68024.1 phosphoribosylanthranilate isomerase [Acaryochloris sp. RU_4_1]NJR56733.1 phosphoribosylanthranilate isomerase [Acaryochloris sp. CRU_2_0]
MRVKICGITQPEQGSAIATLGADALGFICVAASPRYVTPPQIRGITQGLPPLTIQGSPLSRIGVFANADLGLIQQTVAIGQLTGVQLHGDESPEFCELLRQDLPKIELIKAFRIRTLETLTLIPAYEPLVDTLLLDAYTPQALGGTGQTWDWTLLTQFTPQRPWLLAGGLTPENIAHALAQLSPPGIDLSSGVERSPGVKDLQRVKKLFQQLQCG